MTSNLFRINCIVRTVLLAATILLLFYTVTETTLYATIFIIGLAAILQIFLLIRYVENTNRRLARFLLSIRYSDFSQTFSAGMKGSSFEELTAAFNEVISEFQKARAATAEQYRYLQTVVQHVGLGLLAFDQHGEVDLMNNAAKRLLQVANLENITSLRTFSPSLVESLRQIKPGEKTLVKIENNGEMMQLAVYATEFRQQQRSITLVSMQNIESELAEQEMAAWQKLIRVLTHEIMNSVTPIASLASTVNTLIGKMDKPGEREPLLLDEESKNDIHQAAATIAKRSHGLLRFTDAFRNLSAIPQPHFQIFPITELFDRVAQLMNDQVKAAGVDLQIKVEPRSLELTADRELIEQVLINLILNAIHALGDTERKTIELGGRMDQRGRMIITVTDNGWGIPDEVKEKIFTPFFTTRKEGSGIGLNLARQIMRLHKGSISVQSAPHEKTVFTLRF
ncbi:PAS domain-containing sensor histidine kinase [Candidatus Zixiibacteriota bacterium]